MEPLADKARLEGSDHAMPLADKVLFTWRTCEELEKAMWMTVELSEPGPSEECPIAQEPMSSSDLEFLPNVTYREDNKLYRRMQLPCGHAFSAMNLAYHFFKNGMLCPLCRSGSDKPLAALCVPAHFRQQFQARVVAERARDSLETERENLATALNLASDVREPAELVAPARIEIAPWAGRRVDHAAGFHLRQRAASVPGPPPPLADGLRVRGGVAVPAGVRVGVPAHGPLRPAARSVGWAGDDRWLADDDHLFWLIFSGR